MTKKKSFSFLKCFEACTLKSFLVQREQEKYLNVCKLTSLDKWFKLAL